VGFVYGFICIALIFFSTSLQGQDVTGEHLHHTSSTATEKDSASRSRYAGDHACLSCHKETVETYLRTAHHLTSSFPSARSIAGDFTEGSNILKTSNQFLHYKMTSNSEGYFESAVEDVSPTQKLSRTERIDVVVGSGRKGQTYLFWKGDRLFELPVTYWTETQTWVNSPGYPDGSPHFDKPIVPRCLECHGTSFVWNPPPLNRYKKTSLVLGITCEKCHGPAADHIAHEKGAVNITDDIINPAKFSRDQQVDACTLCHAGVAEAIGAPLSYVPGEPIDEYLTIPYAGPDVKVDVHGNQVQLLKQSKCYQSSSMTCSTCHDVHQQQRDAASFSEHCLSCHKPSDCGEHAKMGDQIAKNCVDCHMPLQESDALVSDTNGREIKPMVRNHHIAIYPRNNSKLLLSQ
jgi:hypothetical protein